jgi:hypothetical protein
MKYILIFSILFIGCGETTQEKQDRFLSELECPVILIGKTDKAVEYPAITVRDNAGRIRTMSKNEGSNFSHVASSIADSRQIGDTLKPCN